MLGDAGRTAAVRAGIATAALVLLAAALVLAFGRRHLERSFFPVGSSGLVVLDVSSSIEPTTYRQIADTVAKLASSRDHLGLILFSDVAYEAFPPGTHAEELTPVLRYFVPLKSAKPIPGYPSFTLADRPFPRNPWTAAFTGGTRVSSGLLLARQVIAAEKVRNPYVVLISDLADDYRDLPVLQSLLGGYVRDRIPLRVVALSPDRGDLSVFRHALGRKARIEPAPTPPLTSEPRVDTLTSGLPVGLLAVSALLLLALGAHVLWSVRLPLPAVRAEG